MPGYGLVILVVIFYAIAMVYKKYER